MPKMPLSEASWIEVRARVAYRLIERDWRTHRYPAQEAPARVWALAHRLPFDEPASLEAFLVSFGMHIERGLTTKLIRTLMVERARMGCTWRSVLLWSYKAQRRVPPRVTNRGGHGTIGRREPQ
jgi:hypothetical protein